jgi:dCTP deaminase
MSRGIYTHVEIEALLARGAVKAAAPIAPDQVQPTSLDLRAGPRAFRIRAGFLPTRHTVKERLADLTLFEIDLESGAVLEPGHIYLVPLEEELELPAGVSARANPKSSIGRVDLFTRVICDRAPRFDDIPSGYRGKLYVEVVPRSFPVRVRRGSRLNQLRFLGEDSLLSDAEHRSAHEKAPLVITRDGKAVASRDLDVDGGLNLGLSLVPERDDGIVGYRARRFTGVVDLDRVGLHDPLEFFDPIHATKDRRLLLEPEEFYIFASRERIRVPPDYAAEMLAYDVGIGELRTNYAGFFDAGFGYGERGEILGTPGVLEVRAHDVPFVVEDGQVFFRLVYHRTTRPCARVYGADGSGSNYARQGLTLAKYFGKVDAAARRADG